MRTLRIIKKLTSLKNLTPSEERGLGLILNENPAVIKVLTDYLIAQLEIINIKLNNPKELYDHGRGSEYAACVLAERAAQMKLLTILTDKVEILDEDPGEV